VKVLHVIPAVAARYGGPSEAIRGMCRALARQGQKVTIFTTNNDGPVDLNVPLDHPVVVDGVEIRYFQVQRPRSYVFSLPLAKALKEEVRRFDLVHIHSIFNWPIIPAAFFCRKFGVPYIVRPCGILDPVPLKKAYESGWIPIGMDLKQRYLRRKYFKGRYLKSIYQRRHYLKKTLYLIVVEKRNLEGAAAIHFTSKGETTATEPYGIGAPGFIVPLGVDLNEIPDESGLESFKTKYPNLDGKKIVLFLSRLDAKKGLDLLIPALGKLVSNHYNLVFVLAGSGPARYEGEVRKLLHGYGMTEHTIMTGFVEGRTKWSIFREADIFVLPSYHENFGVAAVEAMSVGIPVVISDQVGIHEEVSKAGAGLVVSQNSEELTQAIAKLLDSAVLRERMGMEARQLVERKFSWEQGAEILSCVYEDVLRKSRRSGAWVRRAEEIASSVL